MKYCTSCGSQIPEGQGSSCSMCYGDMSHGKDNYYRDWAEREERRMKDNEEYRDEQESQNDESH